MYTWNDEAADFWKDQKVLRNTVPLELNEGEIRHRDNRDSEMLIYGYLPLMISAQCVHKNLYGCNHKEEGVTLKDRYDKEFTAKCICNPWKTENTDFCIPCYNIIYNSIPYGLLKEKSQIDRLGVSSLRLAFTIEKPQDAVKIYEEFRDVYRDGKNPPKREYTKGHFKKRSRVRHMINVIVELSKYVILTLMVIYTFHCFYLVKQQSEEERNESLRQQLMLIFFYGFHCVSGHLPEDR